MYRVTDWFHISLEAIKLAQEMAQPVNVPDAKLMTSLWSLEVTQWVEEES